MNIGSNIKELRLSKGMTQEQLAEYTGVSSRAVSRWENSTTYPDITLLPVIANIFEVTVDDLLDVNVYKKEQDIKSIIEKNNEYTHLGQLEQSIDLLRSALKKYPNNYNILDELMTSLFCHYCAKQDEREHLLPEIRAIGEKILNRCNNKSIRYSAIQTLVFIYPKTNELNKAIELINEQPSIFSSREMLLEHVLEDDDLDKLLKSNMLKVTEWFKSIISRMSSKKASQVKIELAKKYIQFMNLVFEGKDMGFYHTRMYTTYLEISINYAKMNMIYEAIDCLIESVNHAIKLEASTITKYESLLLNGYVNDTSSSQTNTTSTNKDRILNIINLKIMKPIKENPRFLEIEKLLECLK